MEFGKMPEAELDQVDFSLPKDPAFNKTVLKGPRAPKPKVYLGCAKWGRREWVVKIYPPKTKEKQFLEEYFKHYNSIELNATHYKIYDEATINGWASKAGTRDFVFCPKMYKGITHFGSLQKKETLTTDFLKSIVDFKRHLGPVFIQVSESFSPKRSEELYEYLESLPADIQFFVEVRHPDFYASEKIMEEFFATLKKLHIGTVITDTAGRRDCAHMYLTVPKAFIRYVGNSLHASDYERMDLWVDRIKKWMDKGLKELYFFMHMHNEAKSPELTIDLVDKLNAVCGLDLKKPLFIQKQSTLFD